MFSSLAMVAPTAVKAAPPQDFKGVTIVVDPGHGGHDAGALAPNGLTEKNVNLSVSKYLANYLHKFGAKVILTRSTDKFIPLPGRAAIANAAKADIFVSVHQNSAPNSTSNGTETYFHKPSAAKLSKYVQQELLKSFGFNNRDSRKAAFAVIKRTTMPGILTEASFMSNPKVANILKSKEGRQKQAMAIFNGLKKQFGIKIEEAQPSKKVEAKAKPAAADKVQVQPVLVENGTNVGFVPPKDNKITMDITQAQVPIKSAYGFVADKVADKEVVGSIDVFKPPVDITPDLTAGFVQ